MREIDLVIYLIKEWFPVKDNEFGTDLAGRSFQQKLIADVIKLYPSNKTDVINELMKMKEGESLII